MLGRLRTGQLSRYCGYLQVSTTLLFTLAVIPLLSPATAPLISLVQVSRQLGRLYCIYNRRSEIKKLFNLSNLKCKMRYGRYRYLPHC
jgi:hypothetical protein